MKDKLPINQIICGDCQEVMKGWPDKSIQCCVTSPPYWGLRDYGTATWDGGDAECDHKAPPGGGTGPASDLQVQKKRVDFDSGFYRKVCGKCGSRRIDQQLGLEKTPEEYVAKMVEVFREVKRVLRDDGTLWLNLGDSYAGSSNDRPRKDHSGTKILQTRGKQTYASAAAAPVFPVPSGLKPKDLCGIPWRVAFALQADGWYLRQDIIWAKPNPMPESVTDRCTKAHEYIFLLTKKAKYFYDAEAIKEPATYAGQTRGGSTNRYEQNTAGMDCKEYGNRNKRSVWTVKPKAFKEAHFATFPPKLIEPCILAGTSKKGCCPECGGPWEGTTEKVVTHQRPPEGGNLTTDSFMKDRQRGKGSLRDGFNEGYSKTTGWRPMCSCEAITNDECAGPNGEWKPVPCIVFDPFMGAGTVAIVAIQHGRDYVGTELSPEYVRICDSRIEAVITGVPEKEARKGQGALFP